MTFTRRTFDPPESARWLAKPILEITYGGVRPDVSEWKYACTTMRAHQGDGIPPQYAALYTKLSFLRDVVDNRSQSICAYNAKVLVTSATVDRVEGTAVLQKAWKSSARLYSRWRDFRCRWSSRTKGDLAFQAAGFEVTDSKE